VADVIPSAGDLADFGLTLAECLAIPPLTRAVVCGGQAGLARRARWVHVVDHDDIEDSLTGNELILSSGVSLGHNAALQQSIFPIMERRASAGLIISLGAYMPAVPDAMVLAADRHGIPLITMPWEVNFRDITQVLLTRIVRNQYQLLENAEAISRSLLHIALNRGTLETLCRRLADITGRPVAVVDTQGEPLACDPAARAHPDYPRLFMAQAGPRRAPREAAETIATALGQHALRAPIVITSRLQGYLVLVTGADQPNRFEGMTVEAATLVAALLIAQVEEIERIRASRERDSFEALLEGSQDPAKLAAFGPLPPGPYSAVVFDIEGGASQGDRRLIRLALEPVAPQARMADYASQIVALLPHARRHTPCMAAARVAERMGPGSGTMRIGLSAPFAALSGMRAAYEDAGDAIALGRLLDPGATVTQAADVAALLPFFRAIRADPGPASSRIRALAEHDAAHGSEFVNTLEAFLQAQQNAAVAARALGIHRHTLGYRLSRMAEVLGIELTSQRALDLRLQMLAFRLAR
jgi:purine catabolism regulator